MEPKFRKVILTGGFISKAADRGVAFCNEVLKDMSQPVKILECIFGMPEKSWVASMEKDRVMFQKACPKIRMKFSIANPKDFFDQIKKSDLVYFRGGETYKLYDILAKINGWQSALNGKVVVGASAGAYILATAFIHSSQPPKIGCGFGVLPIITVTHYRSTFLHRDNLEESHLFWDKVDKIIESHKKGLSAIKLREGEFIVL